VLLDLRNFISCYRDRRKRTTPYPSQAVYRDQLQLAETKMRGKLSSGCSGPVNLSNQKRVLLLIRHLAYHSGKSYTILAPCMTQTGKHIRCIGVFVAHNLRPRRPFLLVYKLDEGWPGTYWRYPRSLLLLLPAKHGAKRGTMLYCSISLHTTTDCKQGVARATVLDATKRRGQRVVVHVVSG
jgi:hypothetical protein